MLLIELIVFSFYSSQSPAVFQMLSTMKLESENESSKMASDLVMAKSQVRYRSHLSSIELNHLLYCQLFYALNHLLLFR